MAKFNYIVITLLLAISSFFFTESDTAIVQKNSTPKSTVQSSSLFNNQGVIENSQIDFSINLSQEENITFFKLLGLINVVFKEEQENYLFYQKTSNLINVALTTKIIIFPFHWFT
ncbi:hypothetical protein CLV86_1053 [Lacinutrix venerupis]|uniref:hypothetical protein n=1 Tax=Lacinutrix venerupis TaxID=1486034 RepID=UPI000EB0A596|nr:hypothetical protein [Lacinutrix venerupis]RLJ65477.1 hypothetical protein CLV86_1053 [Lacinutrix venerupis]